MMNNFSNIIDLLQKQQKLTRSYDIMNAITGTNSAALFGKASLPDSFIRTITTLNNPFTSNATFDLLSKSSKAITALDAATLPLHRIIESQSLLNGIFGKEVAKPLNPFGITGIFNAITTNTASMAAYSHNKEELEAVAHVAEQATAFTQSIEKKKFVTQEDLKTFREDLFTFLVANVIPKKWLKVSEGQWTAFIYFIIATLISFILWRYPYEGKENNQTNEVLQVQRDTLEKVTAFVKKETISKRVIKNFRLRKDPKYGADRLNYIKKYSVVLILNSTNTWAFVTFIDKDGYPVSGWMPKNILSSL